MGRITFVIYHICSSNKRKRSTVCYFFFVEVTVEALLANGLPLAYVHGWANAS